MGGREEEDDDEEEDEGTFERWEMGGEVDGRGGRASVGRATAIGGGKTRKIAGYPSITTLPSRTAVSRHFSIPFSPIFRERAFFTFLSSDLSLFFFLFPSARFRPRGHECAPARRRRDDEPLFPFRKHGRLGFPDNSAFLSSKSLVEYVYCWYQGDE